MIVIELATAPPSGNVYQRMNPFARVRLKHKHAVEIGLALSEQSHQPVRLVMIPQGKRRPISALELAERAAGRRFVRITRRGLRTLDDDRLRMGCVALMDALKFVGLIEDDRPSLVEAVYRQERGTGCRVEIGSSADLGDR